MASQASLPTEELLVSFHEMGKYSQAVELERQLTTLSSVAVALNRAHSLQSVIRASTDEARLIIGAHRAITRVLPPNCSTETVTYGSFSDRYAGPQDLDIELPSSSIQAVVCRTNRPMCLSQSQLESHNEGIGGAGIEANSYCLRSWLGVPLKNGQGTNLGLIELSDKYGEEEFTKTDETILVQLAEMASIAMENCRLSESLFRERVQWTKANGDLQQFVYSVSHDLQEPIRMVVAYSELLMRGCREIFEGERGRHLRFILDGVKRLEDLVRGLSLYTRAANIGDEDRTDVDCNLVLQKTLSNLEGAIRESSALVLARSPLPTVRADEVCLIQLFQNLISNAIKYRSKEPPRIEISYEQTKDAWLFGFTDNGIGIEWKDSQRVFALFKRLHRAETSGTGVGLAICQKIVERYGGQIWIDSEPDKGTTFWFTLPLETR